MKHLLLISLAVMLACQPAKKGNDTSADQPVVSYVSYGETITSDDAQDIRNLREIMVGRDSLEVKLTGEIEKTCKMKGCWMTVKTSDNNTMRVTFANYGFFVPKEGMEGRNAILEGKVMKTVNSVEMLRHFAQDEGKSADEIKAITEPKEEYTFVATGVLIEEAS